MNSLLVREATPQQINAALLDIQNRLKQLKTLINNKVIDVDISEIGNQRDINEADYEGLSDKEKDSDTTFFIPDSEGVDIEVINDEQVSEATTWSSEKISKSFNSIHISDITFGVYTCPSIGQQFRIPLSSFGKNIDRDKVIGFTVLHWSGIKVVADGDWYESVDAEFGCAITPLQIGTGWARVRCTYFE